MIAIVEVKVVEAAVLSRLYLEVSLSRMRCRIAPYFAVNWRLPNIREWTDSQVVPLAACH